MVCKFIPSQVFVFDRAVNFYSDFLQSFIYCSYVSLEFYFFGVLDIVQLTVPLPPFLCFYVLISPFFPFLSGVCHAFAHVSGHLSDLLLEILYFLCFCIYSWFQVFLALCPQIITHASMHAFVQLSRRFAWSSRLVLNLCVEVSQPFPFHRSASRFRRVNLVFSEVAYKSLGSVIAHVVGTYCTDTRRLFPFCLIRKPSVSWQISVAGFFHAPLFFWLTKEFSHINRCAVFVMPIPNKPATLSLLLVEVSPKLEVV